MEIVKLEEYKKTRKLVYLSEGTPAFCLYDREIRKYGIEEGGELTEEAYAEISELLRKRARERCLYLLDDMARTEYQLRSRLKEGFYPEDAIEEAISYCKDKHYIDDLDYAKRFISYRSEKLSIRMIRKKLMEKGIDRDTIDIAFQESEISEADTLRAMIEKKYGDPSDLTFEDKQKAMRKLLSAGFSYDAVKSAMNRASDLT